MIKLEDSFSDYLILDLKSRDIDDDDFREILTKTEAGPIEKIYITGNNKLTLDTIEFILENDQIGNIRQVPRYSSLHGLPCADIEVICDEELQDEIITSKCDTINWNFTIYYKDIKTKKTKAPTAYPAIKKLYFA